MSSDKWGIALWDQAVICPRSSRLVALISAKRTTTANGTESNYLNWKSLTVNEPIYNHSNSNKSRPYHLTIIQQVYNVCICMLYAIPPRCFTSRAPNFEGFIYDPTVGSSQFFFSKFTPLPPVLRTVFSTIVPNYVMQGQGVARRYCNCQYDVAISKKPSRY